MSDLPPTKPKVGSLRDRIAAFEQKPAVTPPDRPAPAPRPKPGGLAWKPRVPSPASDSPAVGSTSPGSQGTIQERKIGGGMSASDAKESIGQGGSLKDRMAALQGRGAFGGLGGGGGPPPPKPITEKPKWKPPVASPIPTEGDHGAPIDDTPGSIQPPPPSSIKPLEDELPKVQGADEPIEGHSEADPEEERQRRAAIAARMARLGGTKVGTQPPVFGKNSSIKKANSLKDEEQVQSSEGEPAVSPNASVKSPAAENIPDVVTSDTEGSAAPADYFAGTVPQRKSSTSSSMLSVESASQPTSSMPVPAMPRRAAPPRKKAAKSPSTPFISDSIILDNPLEESPETSITVKEGGVSDSQHEIDVAKRQPEIGHVDKGANSTPESVKVASLSEIRMAVEFPGVHTDTAATAGDKQSAVYIGQQGEAEKQERLSDEPSAMIEKDPSPIEDVKISTTTSQSEIDVASEVPLNDESAGTEQMEEEATARKKRVAEKLAKMGGFNPLVPRLPVVSLPPVELEEHPSEPPHQDTENVAIQAPKSSPAHEAARSLSPTPPEKRESTLPKSQGHDNEDDLSIQNADPIALGLGEDASAGTTSMHANNRVEGEEEPTNELQSPACHPPVPISTPPQTSPDDESNVNPRRFSPPSPPILPPIAQTDGERKPEETDISAQSSTRPIPPPWILGDKDDAEGEPEQARDNLDEETPPPPPPRRSLPPPPRRPADTRPADISLPLSQSQIYEAPDHTSSPPQPPRPFLPPVPGGRDHDSEVLRNDDIAEETPRRSKPPPPHRQSTDTSRDNASVSISPQRKSSGTHAISPSTVSLSHSHYYDSEILDEEQGDPIDPGFHSPMKHSPDKAPSPAAEEMPVTQLEAIDFEQTRRRTIAERLAKLGGIKFGAAPPIGRPPPSIARTEELNVEPSTQDADEEPMSEKEEERARKQRITAKLAGMGGVGMFGGPPPSRTLQEEQVIPPNVSSPSPPLRGPPPQQDLASELDNQTTQKDEDHELQEEHHGNDVEREEAPPPVPSRAGRPNSRILSRESSYIRQGTQSPSPVSYGRPPVPSIPTNIASRRTSGRQSSGDYISSVRTGSFDTPRTAHSPQGSSEPEYGIVGEPEPISEEPSSAHDRPDIQQSSIQVPPKPPTEINLSPDELTAVWGRVGVQVFEAATALFDKSKRSLIGDGSHHGFVTAVFDEVPSALPPSSSGYGYLIYAQNGSAVQRRVSDIMPGDVVALYDAKLGGRKALTSYHLEVGGSGEPLVGIVSEFETKKSKIKVFQANQHVGQQTVESVSYRLEDLKSGTVKIFRVLHA